MPNGAGVVATDVSTGTIFAASWTQALGPLGAYSIPAISVINPTTKAVTKVIPLNDNDPGDEGGDAGIVDIKVRSASHMVWVITSGWQADHMVYQINGTDDQIIRAVNLSELGYGGLGSSLALEQTADIAYFTTDASYNVTSSETECTSDGPGHLGSINASTGVVTAVTLPNPAQFAAPYGTCEAPKYDDELSTTVAFDQANHSLQVAGTGYLWAYTNKLRLAHTLRLPFAQYDALGVTANGSSNTVYTSDNTKLGVVNGATGTLTSTHTYTAGGSPVIDPSISTVYLGRVVISTSSLAPMGALPHAAQWVNGTTHTIYSADSTSSGAHVYITTRHG